MSNAYVVQFRDADVLEDGVDGAVVVAPLELGDDASVGVFGVGVVVVANVEDAAHQEVDVRASGAGE